MHNLEQSCVGLNNRDAPLNMHPNPHPIVSKRQHLHAPADAHFDIHPTDTAIDSIRIWMHFWRNLQTDPLLIYSSRLSKTHHLASMSSQDPGVETSADHMC